MYLHAADSRQQIRPPHHEHAQDMQPIEDQYKNCVECEKINLECVAIYGTPVGSSRKFYFQKKIVSTWCPDQDQSNNSTSACYELVTQSYERIIKKITCYEMKNECKKGARGVNSYVSL
jgi:hypothetical protein